MNEPLVKLFEALKNDDLPAYLMGEKGYRFEDRWSEVPTDLTAVFHAFNIFVRLNDANKNQLESGLHKAFVELLKDSTGTWWMLSIVFSYFFGFKEGGLFFSIDVNSLLPHINLSLKKYKDDLKVNKNWEGYQFQNGLWDEVLYLVPEINEKLKHEKSPMLIDLSE